MTNKQYRSAIKSLGMTQAAAARFLDVSLRSSQNYALGKYPVPTSAAKLLRLMIRLNLKPSEVR